MPPVSSDVRRPCRLNRAKRTGQLDPELLRSRPGMEQEEFAGGSLYPHDRLDGGPDRQPAQDGRDGHAFDLAVRHFS